MIKRLLLFLLLFAYQVEAQITYVGGAQDAEGVTNTSLTLDFTSFSHQADDFCIIHAMSHDTGTDPVLAVTVATGWTAIGASPYNHIGGTDRQNYLWYKKLTSSSETSPTITTDTTLAHAATLNCFRGVHTTVPFDAAATLTIEDDNNLSLPDNPAIATQTANATILILQAIADGNSTSMQAVAPTGYTIGAHVDTDTTPAVGALNGYAISAYDLDVGAVAGDDPGAWAHTATTGTDAEDNSMFTIALAPAAAGVTFSVSPTVTATTATSYTLGYTVTGATTVYFVACNPGETVPDATEVETQKCGSGAAAEAYANEAVTGADTTAITGIKMPFHDIYAIPASGGTVVTLADEDRAEDTNQDFVTLASVSATSFFALSSDTTGDTTDTSYVIAGMADTSDFAVGMLVDVSAGFADLTDLLVTGITSTSLTLEIAANATSSNITVTSNVYFNPTVAAGDVIEADAYANPVPTDGTHTGSGNAATLTDSTAAFTVDALINSRIANDTDGSACTITDNDATTVTCTLTGGTQNDWDVDDAYTILPLITWQTDGDFSYTAFSGTVLTTLSYCIQDVSDATGQFTVPACWTTDDVIYLFNTAPNFDDMGEGDDVLILDEDVALSGVTMTSYCTDADAHTLTFTFTGTPPTGVTYNSNGTITGTSSSEDETGAALSVLCQDPGLLSARQAFTVFTLNTYTAPDCSGNTVAECLIEWDTAAPWYGVNLSISATGACSPTVSTNDIISQIPAAASEVDDPLEAISVVVSIGGCTNKNTTEMRLKGIRIGL